MFIISNKDLLNGAILSQLVFLVSISIVIPVYGQEPNIVANPTSFDFELVRIGESRERSFAIENTGDNQLIIFATEVSGANANQFSITNGGEGLILEPDQVHLITVAFAPTSIGIKQANLAIDSNDPDSPSLNLILSGQGEGKPNFQIETSEVQFGNTIINSTKEINLKIENIGNADLSLGNNTLIGTGSNAFSLVDNTSSIVIPPLGDTTIKILFTPESIGDFVSLLTIDSNDSGSSPHEINLSGTGVSTELTADTLAVNFGGVTVRDSLFHQFTITNEGESDVTIESFSISGSGASWFSLSSNPPPFTIGAGGEMIIEVKYSPSDDTQHSAMLGLYNSLAEEPLLSFLLEGQGINPEISFNPETIDFGPVLWGIDSTQVISISNAGPGSLVIDSLRVRGKSVSMFNYITEGFPVTRGPNESLELELTFSPFGSGSQSVDLQLFNNSSTTPRFDIRITGESRIIEKNFSTAPIGEDVNLVFNIPEQYTNVPQELFYRTPGETNYRLVNLEGNGEEISGTIPGIVLTEIGVEYYVKITSGNRSSTLPPEDPSKAPEFLPVFIESLEYPLEIKPRSYQMITVPFDLDDYSPESIFVDDFGTYNTRSWRLLRWKDDQYLEYPNLGDSLSSGKGFWLITDGSSPFDIDQVQSISSTSTVRVTLNPGWNQIGNPFAFPIGWTNLSLDPRIELPVGYEGDEFQYQQTTLLPWRGYFINNRTSDTVTVALRSDAPPQPTGGKAVADKLIYQVEFNTYLANYEHIQDSQTIIGLADNSSEDHDAFDYSKPPPIGEFIQMKIMQDDNAYAGNFKPPSSEGHSWELEVSSSIPMAEAIVNYTSSLSLPEGHSMFLLDLDNGTPVSLSNDQFTFKLGEANTSRKFKLILGTEAFALEEGEDIPLEPVPYMLDQNYPNPFHKTTTITFHIDQSTHALLEIFDLMGRRIRYLVNNNIRAGTHVISWNGFSDSGQQIANGVYFYRLQTTSGVLTKKMIKL